MDIRYDCRQFKGTMPCQPHKEYDVECNLKCKYYDSTDGNILIIKLGAMGDVIRTTPLLFRIKKEYPNHRIFWLTHFVDVLPDIVDIPLDFSLESLTYLKSLNFDFGINLDKEPEACALMEQLSIDKKYGFGLKHGMPAPINELAEHKFKTGISDSYSKANTQHYLQEIFSICGWKYNGEEYILPGARSNTTIDAISKNKTYIGLNTGCGERWTSRQWPNENWIELINKLQNDGLNVLLLGGMNENEQNRMLSIKTGAEYFGYFSFKEFVHLMNKCTVVVSTVTMAMHVAIGLKKSLVLLNNIFNPKEFHFFTDSIILEPEKECECFYKPVCVNETSCIVDVTPDHVFEAIKSLSKQ
ncbi:MAG: glycosyltransferase family 9 protein [Candidatus Marinimicrobia bacterium]|jgi:heptosyltransferase-2|nr:glycosyltransferase family 9 protein [Candidatus Neomarinimicrobiota bacterium]